MITLSKKTNVRFGKSALVSLVAVLFFSTFFTNCVKEESLVFQSEKTQNLKSSSVSISNSGFESSFDSWTDLDPSAISSDAYSGSKSAKITGTGGKVSQIVAVDANTDYNLSVFVKGSWRIGVYVNGVKTSRSGNCSDWEEELVGFNSGSQTSITIFCEYNSGDGRFDDFSIVSKGTSTSTGGETTIGELDISNVSASANDGNVPANTIDNDLSTRWSAKGSGQWILYDLGSVQDISSVDIAWYKGDARSTSFEIQAGTTSSSLTSIYSGTSSGSSLELESNEVSVSARYIKIIGYGNSSNTWNSITETEIYGTTSSTPVDETDTTAPGSVSNLSATAGNSSVGLSWTNPSDSDFDHVIISYSGNSTSTTASSKTISGLTNGTTYTFSVVAYDTNGNASSSKTVSATPENTTSSGTYPSDILASLDNWKVTLPVDEDGNDSSNATDVSDRNTNPWEIAKSDLIDFDYSPYFEVRDGEVVFRGHCAGATTSGSKYPRCELRQEVGGGDNYWSVNDYQKLVTELRVTHTPVEKPEVCMVQIHGPENEPMRVQYNAKTGLWLIWNESNKINFADDVAYSLGQHLRVTTVVENGTITCTVENLDNNQEFSYDWSSNDDTGYFKVGCYTQSSIFLSQFKDGYDDEAMDAYGEVVVSKIELTETY